MTDDRRPSSLSADEISTGPKGSSMASGPEISTGTSSSYETPEEIVAQALWQANGPSARYFVMHNGGYAVIARIAVRALIDGGKLDG